MRILVAHNRYQQSGGEDNVAAAEANLLRAHGHIVEQLELDNDRIQGVLSQAIAAAESIYSFRAKGLVQRTLARVQPDVVHVHNFFPSFSPAIFDACFQAGVPVVHTLHNYRLACSGATLFRDGAACEDCLTQRSILPGIRHACYRNSRAGTAVTGLGMALHDRLGTWSCKVSAFIALTEFAAAKLGSFRIPREKIVVKPNFTADYGAGAGDGNYAVFAGRFSPEKGLHTLLKADAAGQLAMDIVLLGDGPLMPEVARAAARPGSRLKLMGRLPHGQILDSMRNACVLLLPSLWYEGLPLVLLEAYSFGLPVLGTDHGSIASLIEPGHTGMLFTPGDAGALSESLAWFANHPNEVRVMRQAARDCYLAKYTPEQNYRLLIALYTKVMNQPA